MLQLQMQFKLQILRMGMYKQYSIVNDECVTKKIITKAQEYPTKNFESTSKIQKLKHNSSSKNEMNLEITIRNVE